jgi:hypothetical protein
MTRKTCSAVGAAYIAAVLCGTLLLAASAHAQSAGQAPSAPATQPADQSPGTITGTVMDATGAVVAGATVTLTRPEGLVGQEISTGGNGQFLFSNVAPGAFQITVTLPGFATQTSSGVLNPKDTFIVPAVTLPLATVVTQVEVVPDDVIAEAQVKQEEKQRVLGVVPNFYVTYLPDAAPLSSKQKFQLAWRSTIDPVTIGITAAVAGIQQWQNEFSGFGGGASGYGKRFGAAYADVAVGTFLSGAVLPSVLKQDPRYFYKGTGSIRSRMLYAIANAVICKGDNKRWQPNYSNILGSLAAGGISNLYYPAQNRDGAVLTFESALIGIGATAASNIFQEFIIRKITPNLPNEDSDKRLPKTSRLMTILAHEGI